MKPSKQAFESFVMVQNSGVTNMFNRSLVCDLACITKEEYMYIIEHYNELSEEYDI